MDRQTYNTQLASLRELRADITTAEKKVAAAQKELDQLTAKRGRQVTGAAAYENAKAEAIAKAAGMSVGEVVRLAPVLDPTPQTVRASLATDPSPAPTLATPEPAPAAAPALEPAPIASRAAEAVPAATEPATGGSRVEEIPAPAEPQAPVTAAQVTPTDGFQQQRFLPSIPDGPAAARYTALTEGLANRRPTWEQNWYVTVWLDASTGDLATVDAVQRVELGRRTPGEILDAVTAAVPGAQRVYVTAGDPWHLGAERYPTLKQAVAEWLNAPSPRWEANSARGAGQDRLASHLVHERNPVGRYARAGVERGAERVEIHSVGQWFDPEGSDVVMVRQAFMLMYEALQRQWSDTVMMAVPSAMGRDLWKRTIPVTGQFAGGYPVMSEELRALMHATAGQGRTELIVPPRVPAELPALVELDRTLAYGRHTWRSGVGAPTRVTARSFQAMDTKQQTKALMAPSHWHIRATVPQGWQHIGLLPAPVPGDRTWEYPATPGSTFTTWAGGAEVNVALNNPIAPWRIEILDGLVWKEGKPLDEWSTRLKTAWSDLVNLSRMHADERQRRAAHLASRGIRSILLYGIGDFARRPRVNTGTTPVGQPVPDGAEILGQDSEVTTWQRVTSLAKDPWAHPEWSAGVWSGARAALLDMTIKEGKEVIARVGALHLPPGSVVALRTDAIYTTEAVRWPYGGQPGEYLLKGHLPGPVPAPATLDELLELRQAGRIHLSQKGADL
ncbi:hypothetical protein ACFW1A_00820 [Kitasatospora sp. NPDC058965]|uniref:hypothetical protein n=1 Tax=Kitasatospora sp. NPDC058965 TaxID=3346682 RepID=UPI0036BBB3BF